ncbi:MAG: hypothetical protein J6A19_03280 [Oscillospiraceae bacterium]|nr:hypothetical protein [Oscillospiraceae bacterium]
MAAQIKETAGACENLTGTLGFADHDFLGRVYYLSMTDMYRRELDAAHMKVVTGATDYMTAIRQACNKLAASGVRTIDYESGRSDRVEVAVRRALMTSVSHITQRISEQNAEEFGADGWEISAHSGARPSHAIYQGRQFPNSKYDSIVKPLIEDYNCRHSAYPIIIGISEPTYTEEELRNIDPPPFTYEGRKYTAYEAQQQMRKMERAMRKQKDRCIVADAAGDEDTFTAASIKLRRQKDIYEDFCKAADSYTQYERTFVAGYNRRLAGKAGAVTRKQRAFENAQIKLDNSVESSYNYMGNEHLFASHYSDGKLDIRSARREYDTFLNSSVPKNHMKLLKQCSYGAKYIETDREDIAMGYSPSADAFVYNPKNPQLANYDLNMSLTHEIAHRIDNKMFKSYKQKAFSEAVSKYKDELDYQSMEAKIKKSDSFCVNAPLQDILSAVSEGKITLAAGHEAEYWKKAGKKQKEIFANLFTLECFNDTEALEFVKKEIPDVYNAYISMTANKLGRDINGTSNN